MSVTLPEYYYVSSSTSSEAVEITLLAVDCEAHVFVVVEGAVTPAAGREFDCQFAIK